MDVGRFEAIQEVQTEFPFLAGCVEVHVGRRNYPDIHMDGLVSSQGGHELVFQDPQKLGLEAKGQLTDLVEEQDSAVGLLEEAR